MATYISLIDLTDQGVRAIQDSPKRAEAAFDQAKQAGITVKSLYWTLGAHDGVLIFEALDDAAASAFLLSLGKAGNVRAQTMRAFDRGEFDGILSNVD